MFTKNIDLHTHSTVSDGSFSPAEIIRAALNLNLGAVALTDHDSVGGIDEFLQAAVATDLIAVPGVEVSCLFSGREVHLLGFFLDHHNQPLQEFLEKVRHSRNERNEEMLRRLRSLGYDITLEEVKASAGGDSVGRLHVATLLIEKGYFKDVKQAFERCLKRGAPGFCPRRLPHPEEAIRLIHQAGGITVWAHPVYRNKFARSHVRGMIRKMKPLGLDGIEGYYPGYTPAQHTMLLELAAMFEVTVSGGTDFHGDNLPSIRLGTGDGNFFVPGACFSGLREYYDKWKQNQTSTSSGGDIE